MKHKCILNLECLNANDSWTFSNSNIPDIFVHPVVSTLTKIALPHDNNQMHIIRSYTYALQDEGVWARACFPCPHHHYRCQALKRSFLGSGHGRRAGMRAAESV